MFGFFGFKCLDSRITGESRVDKTRIWHFYVFLIYIIRYIPSNSLSKKLIGKYEVIAKLKENRCPPIGLSTINKKLTPKINEICKHHTAHNADAAC